MRHKEARGGISGRRRRIEITEKRERVIEVDAGRQEGNSET